MSKSNQPNWDIIVVGGRLRVHARSFAADKSGFACVDH